jgi:pSer/pThr/pTyr-binding forkhead associated (FHA) protein
MRRLLVIADGSVQEVEVGQELTIGRAYTNLLRLEGEEVSRVHAILYKRDQDYLIRDLDSKNGVYLNGQRVTSSIVVSGDEIQIGNYILLFDPPEDFDLTAFLKQRSLEPPDEKKKQSQVKIAAPARAKVHDEETDDRFETSIHFVPQSLPQVFYDISEIEELSQTDALPLSGMFTTELVRALRTLTASGDSVSESERLQRVLEAVTAATHADRGVLVLRDAGSDALRLGAIWPRERDVSVTRVVLRAVLRERQAVLCNDAQSDPRFQQTETVQRENIASMLAYPLLAKNQVLGLIYVDTQGRPNAFRREQLIILQFLAKICVMLLGASEAQQK